MPNAIRLRSDVERVQALAAAAEGRIVLLETPTAASAVMKLDLLYAVPASSRYPLDVRRQTRLSISLPGRYPFQPPVAMVTTPIWHPNVFTAGTICLGTRWIATEGLDLFVRRLARLLTYDGLLVNTRSAANREAAVWYEQARRAHPGAFPTDHPTFGESAPAKARPRVGWTEQATSDGRVGRACPSCGRTLRLPPGRSGTVRCPGCGTRFEART